MRQALASRGDNVADTDEKIDQDIAREVRRLLALPISDEKKVMEGLVDAITEQHTKPELVEQAVRQTVHKYENKLRVFAIAAANRQLRRIIRLIDTLDVMEEELNDPGRLAGMESKDLIRLYSVTQGNLTTSLDYVKKVLDMRMELAQAMGAMSSKEQDEIETLSGLPTLNSTQRDKVRRLISGMTEEVIDVEVVPVESPECFVCGLPMPEFTLDGLCDVCSKKNKQG
jgi:hypothetical protein